MTQQKNPRPAAALFTARFVNGVHTVFSRHHFTHGAPLRTAKQAEAVARDLNAGRVQW